MTTYRLKFNDPRFQQKTVTIRNQGLPSEGDTKLLTKLLIKQFLFGYFVGHRIDTELSHMSFTLKGKTINVHVVPKD